MGGEEPLNKEGVMAVCDATKRSSEIKPHYIFRKQNINPINRIPNKHNKMLFISSSSAMLFILVPLDLVLAVSLTSICLLTEKSYGNHDSAHWNSLKVTQELSHKSLKSLIQSFFIGSARFLLCWRHNSSLIADCRAFMNAYQS